MPFTATRRELVSKKGDDRQQPKLMPTPREGASALRGAGAEGSGSRTDREILNIQDYFLGLS